MPDIGQLLETGDPWEPYQLLDVNGARVGPVATYFTDLLAAGSPASTLRSYGMDLLRWWRFLWAIGDLEWDRAVREDARDFMLAGPLRGWRLHRRLHEGATPVAMRRPPEPVQAALTVLGRRPQNDDEPFWINLARTDLRGAELSGARLGNVDLYGAHLQGANLSKAHLEGANLVHAHLEGAILAEAHLEKANMVVIHLEEANLVGAHLEEAMLIAAHLERANLDGAHLVGSHLEMAHMDGASLEGARLIGAHLDGTRLEGALSLTVGQLVLARPCERTTLPAGLDADARVRARITEVGNEVAP
ncbi:pentapeptide repeat-containing protein [Kitasatospora sp. NPDC001574]